MTAVVSFYFASRAAAPTAAPPKSSPKLANISPTQAAKGAAPLVVPVKIIGTDLQLAKTVKFDKGTDAILATNVMSNDQEVHCQLTVAPTAAPGKYDINVTTSDDQTATLTKAFEVTDVQAANRPPNPQGAIPQANLPGPNQQGANPQEPNPQGANPQGAANVDH